VLVLALTMGQALVALHGYAHAPAQTVAECSVCRLAAQPARVTAVLVDLLELHAISIELGATPYAPYVRPVHRSCIARASPLQAHVRGKLTAATLVGGAPLRSWRTGSSPAARVAVAA
jgi:hypothetical protein